MVRLIQFSRKHVRDYSSRREQWRLLLLIVPLGLVIVLMARLRDPETADRINRFFAPAAMEQPRESPPPTPAHRVRLFAGVQRELLPSIEDNTYFRRSEQNAWFHFIEVLQNTPAAELHPAQGVEVVYTQLVDQPRMYRGTLVNVRGSVRQVTEQKPAKNELGIDYYFRVVLQPADGTTWPIFVYCLELPTGLKPGDDLAVSVVATGLFFKNLSYRGQEGMGTAPVVLARTVEFSDSDAGVAGSPVVQPDSAAPAADQRPREGSSFRELLALAGWNAERLAEFDDGQPWSDDKRQAAIELLRRLRGFDSPSLDEWTKSNVVPGDVLSDPQDARGELIQLNGRVTGVIRHVLDPADAERLVMGEYFECVLKMAENARSAIIVTARAPRAWLDKSELNEPASANALYLSRLPGDKQADAVWIAKELAWHPTEADEPGVSFGKSLLGTLGMDVGLLDQVSTRGRIRAAEREAFYQMLHVAGQIGPQQLARFANANLGAISEAWQREAESAKDPTHRILAQQVVERAAEGRYSVAPLFNVPESQIGRLIVVDGVARRVTRVEVGSPPDGRGSSDMARRFGFNHYYEVEVFTDDSQNYPLVFCVRELPAGFPAAGSIHVPVRVAGFFFKDWLYHTRGSQQSDVAGVRAQYAPLLIGSAPQVLAMAESRGNGRFFLGGVFLTLLAGIAAVAAWYARDRQFRQRTRAASFSLPPGQSLNELNLSAADEPMKSSGSDSV